MEHTAMRLTSCLAFALALSACHGAAVPTVTPVAVPTPAHATLDDAWQPLSYAIYLGPTDPAAYASGTVDVIFHFHAGRAAEAEYRDAGARAVVVAITVDGIGTTPYWALMDDPNHFEHYKTVLVKALSKRAGHPMSIGRIALVAWSAGYATVQRILAIQRHYDEVDAVILLDGLHTGYTQAPGSVQTTPVAPGTSRHANLVTLAPFVKFAKDAAAGKKLFVFTHSSIATFNEGYASTTEVADALAPELGMSWSPDPRPGPPGARRSADLGDAHLRGFPGEQARDHVAHDHFVGAVVRTWLLPRWK
jgi:hypothetical protein